MWEKHKNQPGGVPTAANLGSSEIDYESSVLDRSTEPGYNPGPYGSEKGRKPDILGWIALAHAFKPNSGGRRDLFRRIFCPSNPVTGPAGPEELARRFHHELLAVVGDPDVRSNAEAILQRLNDPADHVSCMGGVDFPRLLLETSDPPIVLYWKGRLPGNIPAVAIVGSRECSSYGRRIARRLAFQLASSGVAIISGLARGIDRAAHEGALEAGGVTFGILGCGLDVAYPKAHKELVAMLTKTGGILTEFPPGTPPLPQNFPVRNRIIAGLAYGTVVVEAAKRSGSLITARMSAEMDREVYAVPGPVDSPGSAGTLSLLRDGAKLVRSAEDVIEELPSNVRARLVRLNRNGAQKGLPQDLSSAQLRIWRALDPWDPKTVDEVAALTSLQTGEVLAALLELEIRELVEQKFGKQYVRRENKEI